MRDVVATPEKDQRTAFLDGLASGLSVTGAAAACGLHRSLPYRWRDADPEFRAAWALAEKAGTDLLEDEAWRRAFRGTEKPVYQGGVMVGTITEYSDTLTIFLLKGRRPEKYRENIKADVTVTRTFEDMVNASLPAIEADK